MDHDRFLELAAKVSDKCLTQGDVIDNLVLTNGPANKPGHLTEPQLRHLWALMADREHLKYSFEAPTSNTYTFKGKQGNGVRGRHDLVLHFSSSPERQVLIELKHALSAKSIKTDLVKLLKESAQPAVVGCAVMFVAESTTVGLQKLRIDLPAVITEAWNDSHLVDDDRQALKDSEKWFEVLVVVRTGDNRGTYRSGDITFSTLLESHRHPDTLAHNKDWAQQWEPNSGPDHHQ
ncbi:MAG: hypothetical protein ACOYD0_09860 [Candidatus Nanopelagicales bacterium]